MTMSKKKKCLFCDKVVGEAQLPQHLSSFHAIDPTAFDDILDLEDDNDVVSRPPQQLERDDEDTAPASATDEDSKATAEQPPDADATEDTTVPEEKEATTNVAAEVDAESWTEQCLWECKACEFRCRSSSIARAHCVEEHGEKAEAEYEISARTMFPCPQTEKEVLWVGEEIVKHIETVLSMTKSAFFETHKDYITKKVTALQDSSQDLGVFVPTLSVSNHHGGEENLEEDAGMDSEEHVATEEAQNPQDGSATPASVKSSAPSPLRVPLLPKSANSRNEDEKEDKGKVQQQQETNYEVILPSPEQLPPPSPNSMNIAADITDDTAASGAPPAPPATQVGSPSEVGRANESRQDPQSLRAQSPTTSSSSESNQAASSPAPRSDYGLLKDAVPDGPTKWFDQCLFECTVCGKRQYPIAAMKTHCRQVHGDPTCQKKVLGATYRCLFSNCMKEISCDRISIECHIRSGQHKLRNMREYDAMFTVEQHMAAVKRLPAPDKAANAIAPAAAPTLVPLMGKSASASNESAKSKTAGTEHEVVKIVSLTAMSQKQKGTEIIKPTLSTGDSVNAKSGKEAEVAKPVRPSLRVEAESKATSERTSDPLSSQAEVVADVEECLATLGEAVSAKEKTAESLQPVDGPGRRKSSSSEERVKMIKVAAKNASSAGDGESTTNWMDKCEFTCRDCKMTVGRRQQMQLHVNRSALCAQRSYDTSRKVYHRCRLCNRDILNESTSIVSHLSKTHSMKVAQYAEKYVSQKDNGVGVGGERPSRSPMKRKLKPATLKRSSPKKLKLEVSDGPAKSGWYNKPGRPSVHVCRMCRWRIAFDEEALVHHFRSAHGMVMEDYTKYFMKYEDDKNTKKCPICESPIPREAIEDHAINCHRMPKEKFAQLARSLSKSRAPAKNEI